MFQNRRIVVGLIALVVVAGVAAAAYIWLSGGSGQASQVITAPTLDIRDVSNPQSSVTQAAPAAGDATEPVEAATTAQAAAGIVFNIIPEKSQVLFTIHEVLRGNPTEVIGTTDQVAGQIFVNADNPAQSEVGTIRVNVRTLKTPEEFRDRAIRGQILQSSKDEFEFSEFKPTSLEGLPDKVTVGQEFTFKINGDLTVRDISQPVTFEATATLVSKTELQGTATTGVTRTQYNLVIPNVPFVADVQDDVELRINFVAEAAA